MWQKVLLFSSSRYICDTHRLKKKIDLKIFLYIYKKKRKKTIVTVSYCRVEFSSFSFNVYTKEKYTMGYKDICQIGF